MTPQQFFDNFGHLADAPNGIKKLRELILQLAVRGKLVPQDPADEPAAKLLERIRAEKARLASEKRARNAELLSSVPVDCGPYDLPNGWEWVSIGEVAIIQGGKRLPAGATFSEQPTSHIYIQVTNMKNGTILAQNLKYVSDAVFDEIRRYTINKQDLYITIAGTIAQPGEVPEMFDGMNLTENAAKLVFRSINKRFFLTALQSEPMQSQFREKTNQLAQPKLALKRIADALVPLPPLAEQGRIVAKINQLMALCDELEARQQKSQKKLLRLNNAVLDRLTSASGSDDYDAARRLVRDSFDLLYTTTETIGKLRQAILQLAVQGKLVQQDPTAEPATKLLERIRVEKARLVKEKKIRNAEQLTPVAPESAPYKVPHSWEWVRLGELREIVEYGTSQKAHDVPRGVPILRMNNIVGGGVLLSNLKYVESTIDELPKLYLRENDLLFNRTNSYELVGKTGIFKGESDKFTFASYLIRVRLLNLINPQYVNLVMNSPFFRSTQIEPEVTQQCGQANFNGTKLINTLIPLPPVLEQQHIVEKVDHLMALCDTLEAQLNTAKVTAESLTAAAGQGVLAA
ncbi:restriction endonuclease subunit S [Geomonas edaphica]|uniref:restriction endonuclease subunit S n=1 Tax=Geomonas edaphica TaxID=2570226 RepID=UPI0010A8CCA2|nr:restriction endonuclease subunit S [Geomonas edaphica]